jgi:hypothetical protein
MTSPDQREPQIHRPLLDASEQVHVEARAEDALVIVTDQRVVVARGEGRFDLAIGYEALRRVQFDIERTRPAVLVIVPERATDQPQVLSIPPDQYETVGQALAVIGARLYGHPASDEGPKRDMSAAGGGGQIFGG